MSQFDHTNGVNDNHSVLLKILSQQRSGLNVVHFNARSLNGLKLDHVRTVFEKSNIDIICVSETWFQEDVSDLHYNIKGYKMFHNDRKGRKGGGVAIYCKDNLKAKLINKSLNCEVEFINVEVCDNVTKILVSCVYNPNKNFSLEPYFSDFSDYVIDYDFYVTCGDFNINILNEDRNANVLCDLVNSVGLSFVNENLPTRFSHNCHPSLIDYILISDKKLLLLFDQLSFVSDHDLLFCTLDVIIGRTEVPLQYITYRDFKSINYQSLFHDLSNESWTDCWYLTSVDDKLKLFLKKFQDIYNKHVPTKTICIENNTCPWFTSAVKRAIRYRNRCHNNWKQHPTETNRNAYNKARNKATTITRLAKLRYYAKKLNVTQPVAQLWKNIKNLGVHSRGTFDCNLDPDDLNDFFCENDTINGNTGGHSTSSCCSSVFDFINVSEEEVVKAVMNLRSNAIGHDEVSLKFLKISLPYVFGCLTHIFNHCVTTSVFPKVWKVGKITPIAKITSAKSASDYRPISILSVLSKVFESLLSKQITDYLCRNELLSPYQSGFRAGHSCKTAVLKVIDDIRIQYDNGNATLMCFLDFSKAFDKVDHSLLCEKLKHNYGFTDTAIMLMNDYLTGRTQKVVIGNKESCLKSVTSGVPQGSVLGPLLFSIFVNDVFRVCKNSYMHAYADDIQLYISSKLDLIDDTCFKLNEDLVSIKKWADDNHLLLNSVKSFVLPIYRSVLNTTELSNIYLGNIPLQFVKKTKYLGFHINSSLSCADHINNIVRTIYFILRNLRVSSYYTPTETKKRLVLQLIVPHINYSAEVFSKLDSHSMHKLQVAFNNAVRYIYGLTRYSSMTSWRKLVLGCDLTDYIRLRNLMFLHRLLHCKSPLYLFDKLVFGFSARSQTLILPRHTSLLASRTFFVNAIKLWNTLPTNIKLITRKNSFKKYLLDFIISN